MDGGKTRLIDCRVVGVSLLHYLHNRYDRHKDAWICSLHRAPNLEQTLSAEICLYYRSESPFRTKIGRRSSLDGEVKVVNAGLGARRGKDAIGVLWYVNTFVCKAVKRRCGDETSNSIGFVQAIEFYKPGFMTMTAEVVLSYYLYTG